MKNISIFYLKIFLFFFIVKFSIYLNRRVSVMITLSRVYCKLVSTTRSKVNVSNY